MLKLLVQYMQFRLWLESPNKMLKPVGSDIWGMEVRELLKLTQNRLLLEKT